MGVNQWAGGITGQEILYASSSVSIKECKALVMRTYGATHHLQQPFARIADHIATSTQHCLIFLEKPGVQECTSWPW